MKTVLVGIARMGSSRFPGKVLAELGGMPVLQWISRAAGAAKFVDGLIIATTTEPRDDAIAHWCASRLIECYRGSEDDVLERFYHAAQWMGADVAVRVTCDCPFIDPNVIDQVVALREATGADYASNIDPPTWPDGLDCEAITIRALEIAAREATSRIDRECVTTYTQRNRHRFKCETLICPLPGMHKERWVLDTEDDYRLCQIIVDHKIGGWLNIKRFLDEHPRLRELNAHHPRNERYFAALAQEPLEPRGFTASKQLLEKAKKVIPLGAQTFSKSEIQYPTESPLFVSHADGGYCYDVDGNRYVDLVGGLLPVILGHRDPDVDDAVRRQLNRGACFSLSTALEAELAETLCRLIPCADWARFGKNGSDVTSAAIRLARAHTGRDYIISSGYHGWHDWAVVKDEVRNKGVPQNVGRDVYPFYDVEEGRWPNFQSAANVAAVIVEPETKPEFLQECRDWCDKYGALLIFDEIITGFRFGMGGAQEFYGVIPDIACFGKAMGNGYPISAIVGKKELYDTMASISYSGTFFGDPIGLTAAIATIEKLERQKALESIWFNQGQLCGAIAKENISSPRPLETKGSVCFPRLEFLNNDVKTLFIQEMAQQGVLIIASHNLSYAHGENELRRVVTAYSKVLPFLADAIERGKVKDFIRGRSIPKEANVRAMA